MQNHKKFVSTTVQVFLNVFFVFLVVIVFLLLLFVLQLFSFFLYSLVIGICQLFIFSFLLGEIFYQYFFLQKVLQKNQPFFLTLRILLYSLIRAVHSTVKFCCEKILALVSHFKFFIFSDFDKNEKMISHTLVRSKVIKKVSDLTCL